MPLMAHSAIERAFDRFEMEYSFFAAVNSAALSRSTQNILFFALIFGGLAIILAVLSKGSSAFMSNPAVAGMITGSISIAMVFFMLAVSIYSVFFIPEYRQQFNTWYKETYEQLYGQPDDEGLDQIFYNTDIPRVGGGDL